MKILQPHKISSEILDVIYEAKEYLVIVSPYVDFKYWQRMESELLNAKKRGVRIDFFVRADADNANSWEQVESLGLRPRLVNNLHAKFYFNERSGVISSMNLLSYSQSNSIEIGCKLETPEELEDLKRFTKDFLKPNESNEKPDEFDAVLSKEKFMPVLEYYLQQYFGSRVTISYKNGALNIYAESNNYTLSLDKLDNKIAIAGIVSGKEAQRFKYKHKQYFSSSYFEYELVEGGNGYYDMIGGTSKAKLSQSYLDGLKVSEKRVLIEEIAEFIKGVKEYKDSCN